MRRRSTRVAGAPVPATFYDDEDDDDELPAAARRQFCRTVATAEADALISYERAHRQLLPRAQRAAGPPRLPFQRPLWSFKGG